MSIRALAAGLHLRSMRLVDLLAESVASTSGDLQIWKMDSVGDHRFEDGIIPRRRLTTWALSWRELSSDDFRNAFQGAMCVDSTELPVASSDYLHRILSASGLPRIDLDQRSWIEPRTLLLRKPCSRRCTLRHPVCALCVRAHEVVEDAVQRGNDDEHEQRREPVRIDAAVARLRLGADEPRGDGEANRERNDQRPLMCSMWRMRSDRQASNNGRYDWPGLQTCHAEERGVLDGRKNALMPGNFDRGPCRCATAYQDGFIGGGGR